MTAAVHIIAGYSTLSNLPGESLGLVVRAENFAGAKKQTRMVYDGAATLTAMFGVASIVLCSAGCDFRDALSSASHPGQAPVVWTEVVFSKSTDEIVTGSWDSDRGPRCDHQSDHLSPAA